MPSAVFITEYFKDITTVAFSVKQYSESWLHNFFSPSVTQKTLSGSIPSFNTWNNIISKFVYKKKLLSSLQPESFMI